MALPYGVGERKKTGHQYQWVDEGGYGYNVPTSTGVASQSLRDVYAGRFVKHVFCAKCGDYRAIELKASKELKKFHNMERLKG